MFFAGKVDINTVEVIGSRVGGKIIQIAGTRISFKENPKDGLRVQLLILNTFHKATDSQTLRLDKTLVSEKMHQSLFMVLIDTPDLTDQCGWTLLCNVHCFQCKQFELFYY